MTSIENMKRYWRRRKYQRLDGATTNNKKRKVKIARFGNQKGRQAMKINIVTVPRVLLKFMSPMKLFSKFHNDSILRLAPSKNDKKGRPLPIVSGMNNEIVDGRLVLEVYKRLVSNRQVAAAAAALLV